MEVYQLDDMVEVHNDYLPSGALNKPYRIIGMRKITTLLGVVRKDFLISTPSGVGWELMFNISSGSREVYYISSQDYQPGKYGYWVSEVGVRHASKITKGDGGQCLRCKDFVYMAKSDGFICRACVLDPYRCSPPSWNGD